MVPRFLASSAGNLMLAAARVKNREQVGGYGSLGPDCQMVRLRCWWNIHPEGAVEMKWMLGAQELLRGLRAGLQINI